MEIWFLHHALEISLALFVLAIPGWIWVIFLSDLR